MKKRTSNFDSILPHSQRVSEARVLEGAWAASCSHGRSTEEDKRNAVLS